MTKGKIIALLGAIAMTLALANGFTVGDFTGEGATLLGMPWGIVSLVDLYVGFVLFSAWIVYREASPARACIWVILMMTLGFFAASIYVLLALQGSRGNWPLFWMGKRATNGG
jgi:hypothetical protein